MTLPLDQTSLNGKSLTKQIEPPFGYFGSKRKLASAIAKLLPPHNAWVEAFCGSAAITLAKSPSPIEVINDLDGEIVNLFQQLRDNSRELCRRIALTPYSREEFSRARHLPPIDHKVERARRFLVSSMMSINGVFGQEKGGFSYSQSYARNGREARVNRWYQLPERLEHVVERLRNIRIENRDGLELIKSFSDKPATLVYIDPPYLAKRTNGYRHEANDRDFHEELLQTVKKARCMILLSGYDHEMYRRVLEIDNDWERIEISTTTRDSKGCDHKRSEILWKNPLLIRTEKAGRSLIRFSAKEKENGKINPSRR